MSAAGPDLDLFSQRLFLLAEFVAVFAPLLAAQSLGLGLPPPELVLERQDAALNVTLVRARLCRGHRQTPPSAQHSTRHPATAWRRG